MIDSVVAHRRALHQIPETHFDLPKTLDYVLSALAPLHCTVTQPMESSVCAFFDAGKDCAIAFRADMDALPLQEATANSFCSTHPGNMHACGHDGHMAMVLALGEYLSVNLASLPYNVLLIFQPAEEGPGGAQPLCQTGVLQTYGAKHVFGIHLWPNLPLGKIVSCPGPMLAQANEIDVEIIGKSVHLSRSEQGHDALVAGMEYLRQAYALLDAIDPTIPRKLRFGKMESGTVRNAISGHTMLSGSMRTYDAKTFAHCYDGLHAIGQSLEKSTGCTIHVDIRDGYDPVWNDEALYQSIAQQLGADAPLPLAEPSLAGEDFSFYQREVPGVFFFLGLGQTPELHAVDFDFDDTAVLHHGVEFFKKLLYLNY